MFQKIAKNQWKVLHRQPASSLWEAVVGCLWPQLLILARMVTLEMPEPTSTPNILQQFFGVGEMLPHAAVHLILVLAFLHLLLLGMDILAPTTSIYIPRSLSDSIATPLLVGLLVNHAVSSPNYMVLYIGLALLLLEVAIWAFNILCGWRSTISMSFTLQRYLQLMQVGRYLLMLLITSLPINQKIIVGLAALAALGCLECAIKVVYFQYVDVLVELLTLLVAVGATLTYFLALLNKCLIGEAHFLLALLTAVAVCGILSQTGTLEALHYHKYSKVVERLQSSNPEMDCTTLAVLLALLTNHPPRYITLGWVDNLQDWCASEKLKAVDLVERLEANPRGFALQYVIGWLLQMGHRFKAFFLFYRHRSKLHTSIRQAVLLELARHFNINIWSTEFCSKVHYTRQQLDVRMLLEEQQRLMGVFDSLHNVYSEEMKIYSSLWNGGDLGQAQTLNDIVRLSEAKKEVKQLIRNGGWNIFESRMAVLEKAFLMQSADLTKKQEENLQHFKPPVEEVRQQYMYCVVSGEESREGQLINCNIDARVFLGLSRDALKNKAINIKRFLPTFVRSVHSKCMRRFSKKVQVNRIGHPTTSFIIKNGQPHEIRMTVKPFVSEGGLQYTAKFKWVGRHLKHVLFNEQLKVEEVSPSLSCLSGQSITKLLPADKQNLSTEAQLRQLEKLQSCCIKGQIMPLTVKLYRYSSNNLFVGAVTLFQSTERLPSVVNLQAQSESGQSPKQSAPVKKRAKCQPVRSYHVHIRLMLLGLLITCFSSILWCETDITDQSSGMKDVAAFYLRLSNGIRTRIYEMSTRLSLLRLQSLGAIPSNIIADDYPDVPDFSEYLRNTSSYFQSYDPIDQTVIRRKLSVVPYLTSMKSRELPWYGKGINFMAFIRLSKSFYHEIGNYSDSELLASYPLIHDTASAWVKMAPQINISIYWPIYNSVVTHLGEPNVSDASATSWLVLVLVLVGMLVAVVAKLHQLRAKSIQILSTLDMKKIEDLRQLAKHRTQLMSRASEEGQNVWELQVGYTGKAAATVIDNNTMTSTDVARNKNTLPARSLLKQQANTFLVLSLIVATIGCAFYFHNASLAAIRNSITYYYGYTQSVTMLRGAIATLFDMLAKAVEAKETGAAFPPPNGYFGVDWNTSLEKQKTAIGQRSVDDLIRNQLSWNDSQSLLYDSLCNSDSSPSCFRLLKGALTRGTQASLIEFETEVVRALADIQVPQQNQFTRWKVCELMYSYDSYLRPRLSNMQQQSYNILTIQLQNVLDQVGSVLWRGGLPLLLFAILLAVKIMQDRHRFIFNLQQECIRIGRAAGCRASTL